MSSLPPDEARAYPPDEFDDVGEQPGRRGAHRAKPSPVLAMLPVLLVVLAVVAVVVGMMTLLGGGGTSSSVAQVPGATGQSATTPGASSEPPATPSPSEASTAPAAPLPETTAPAVDRTVPVTVLNGTRRSGLAGQATEVLRDKGWTVPRADNFRGDDTPPTTVFYPREDLASTAAAVAADLGRAATTLSSDFGEEGLTVVLGDDYEP